MSSCRSSVSYQFEFLISVCCANYTVDYYLVSPMWPVLVWKLLLLSSFPLPPPHSYYPRPKTFHYVPCWPRSQSATSVFFHPLCKSCFSFSLYLIQSHFQRFWILLAPLWELVWIYSHDAFSLELILLAINVCTVSPALPVVSLIGYATLFPVCLCAAVPWPLSRSPACHEPLPCKAGDQSPIVRFQEVTWGKKKKRCRRWKNNAA